MQLLLPTVTLLLLAGCPGEETGDSKEPEDTDTGDTETTDTDTDDTDTGDTDTGDTDTGDTDTGDTDTGDTDTGDTDTGDTDTGERVVFTGTTSMWTADGCDIEASLVGTDYTGPCPECEFEIKMESTVTRGDTSACAALNLVYYNFVTTEGFSNLSVGYAPEYVISGYFGDYTVTNAWATFFHFTGYYGYYGYYYNGDYGGWVSYVYNGYSYGPTFTMDGDNLSWSLDYYTSTSPYYYSCGASEGLEPPTSATTAVGSGSIPCDGSAVDVWTFTADAAEMTVSVDTVSESTTFDPAMWIQAPDACTVAYRDDSFACTFPPPNYECPSQLFPEPTIGGSYQVVITSLGDCTTDTVEYSLMLDNGSAAVQTHDDVPTVELYMAVEGSGTLSL